MENNIGVGLIVGLTFASSIYVWNNEKFSSVQKTILLICIVFPPAQWIGILVVLAYNSNKVNNSIEKITERKVEQIKVNLDNSISNLADLKDKGILTELEYYEKVANIKTKKAQQDILNSTEYKQLKSLLDGGILTKEEFDNKIKLIQNVSEKEVDIEEINSVINSVNTTYLDNVEEKEQDKKGSSAPIYILTILFFVILIGSVIIYSDNNNNETTVDSTYVEPMVVDTLNTNVNSYQEPLKTKKFVYLVFKIDTPKLDALEIIGNALDNYRVTGYYYSTKWEEMVFSTEVIEVEDYTEDNKNRMLDKFEAEMESKLKMYDYNYSFDVKINCKDDSKKESLLKEQAKITKRDVYEFNTYSEASLSKRNTQ
jgi:Short C-terminal domain